MGGGGAVVEGLLHLRRFQLLPQKMIPEAWLVVILSLSASVFDGAEGLLENSILYATKVGIRYV